MGILQLMLDHCHYQWLSICAASENGAISLKVAYGPKQYKEYSMVYSEMLDVQETMYELKNNEWMQITFVLKYRTLENEWFIKRFLHFYSFKDVYTHPTPHPHTTYILHSLWAPELLSIRGSFFLFLHLSLECKNKIKSIFFRLSWNNT